MASLEVDVERLVNREHEMVKCPFPLFEQLQQEKAPLISGRRV